MLTAVSLFAGIGGIDHALDRSGIKVVAAVEIDPAARGVLAGHFPGTALFDDVTEVTGDQLLAAGFDPGRGVVTAGWPCFAAGTRILAERGLLPIEDVQVGDLVLTHSGRWMPVTTTMSRVSDHSVTVQGHGIPRIVTTEEHPFHARAQRKVWVGRSRGPWRREFCEPEWVDASKLQGQFASQVLPPVEDDDRGPAVWWLVGRYLADGWTTYGGRGRDRVVLCCSYDEADGLADRIRPVVHATRADDRTEVKFTVTQRWFVDLVKPLGRGAVGKTLTRREFALSPAKAEALLDGWLTGDGSSVKGRPGVWSATTVSRSLALSMALMAQRARGVVASVHPATVAPTTIIEGRTVRQRSQYQVVVPLRNRSAMVEGDYGWKLVRHVVRTDEPVLVYNLSVAGDESYVADGAIVHNCQDFSVAGRRLGLGGARSGLFWEVVRLVDELVPRWLFLENVVGLLSSVCPCPGDGSCGDGCPARPHPVTGGSCGPARCMELHGGAMGAVVGALADLGYGLAWRVLDAQYFGVPQRRRRVFFVGHLGDGAAPVRVLLEPEGGGRDLAPGGTSGAGAAGVAALSASDGGPDDNDATGGRLIVARETGRGWWDEVSSTGTPRAQGGSPSNVVVGPLQSAGAGGRGQRVDADGAASGHLVVAPIVAANHHGDRANCESHLVVAAVSAKWAKGTGGPSGDETQNLTVYTVQSDASEDGTGRGTPLLPVAFDWQTDGSGRAMPNISGERTSSIATTKRDAVALGQGVRRLSPVECERLQGLPDGWTARSAGRPQSDSARYRQLGNSVAVPVVEWVARRLAAVDEGVTVDA